MIARIRSIPSWQVTLGAALLGLGFLIAAQLAAEGPRVRYTTQERSPLVETATQLQRRQDELKARILELRGRIQATEQADAGSAELVRELNDDLQDARIAAGLIPLTGTGIVLQVEDLRSPQRRDRTRPTTWSAPGTCAHWSRSCGRRAPRRSRSMESGSRRPPRSSMSARQFWSTPRTWPARTRSPLSARRISIRGWARRPASSTSSEPGRRGMASVSRSPSRKRSTCPRSPAR